ncbi:MAG: hypothetical protein QG597_1477 [Actinomycetota bacterium]|nr:hypothetical protein [Actinomycetota bacterium]
MATKRQQGQNGCGCVVLAVLGIALLGGLGSCFGSASEAPGTGSSAVTSAPAAAATAAAPTRPTAGAPPGATAPPPPPAAAAGSALAVLDTLAIKGRAPKTGYARDEFGDGWQDPDGNGCDARNDVLRRDLADPVLASGDCKVLTGTLNDPYTDQTIAFVRGEDTSAEVQIDHVVALSDAWQKGAQQLTPTQRETFANDPLNLLAVGGAVNQTKSDGDAATWLPPQKAYRCEYVARQVAVKQRYSLWVTTAEHDAIARILATCPDQPLPQ